MQIKQTRQILNNSCWFIILYIILSLCGCKQQREYYDIKSIGEKLSSSYLYTFDMADSIGYYDMTAIVRYTPRCVESNFDFVFEVTSPKRRMWQDTVSLALKDSVGMALGYSNTYIYNLEQNIFSKITFLDNGRYNIIIRPLNRDIEGIVDIGIKVAKTESKSVNGKE